MKDFEKYSQQNLQFYWNSVPHFFETIINHLVITQYKPHDYIQLILG